MSSVHKPFLLLILDGWGHREAFADNAIANAETPTWKTLWADYPHTLIETSGRAVGLPDGQMGNSEVGHMNLGAGRVVYQDFTRIGVAIENGEFFRNAALCQAIDAAVARAKAVHVFGLLSPGGVHSHEAYLHAAVELAARRGARRVYAHAFLDGRDTLPSSAAPSIAALEAKFTALGCGRIASLVGRYYAMDRDQRWERVQAAFELIVEGKAPFQAESASAGLALAYARGETDEFVKATAIAPADMAPARVEDGDSILFMNFRADRARQLTRAFVDQEFSGFARIRAPKLGAFVCLTQYQQGLPAAVAFPPQNLHNGLGELFARHGLKQLRIAETEKYAHVTFFFNGGEETVFPGEDRILVPSPKVATYDLQPEMSALALTDQLVAAIEGGAHDVIICNFANPDMVGHTGVYAAALKAVETIDRCLGRIYRAITKTSGEMLITADHGNIEMMRDDATGQPHTAHTTNPVPLVYVGRRARLAAGGALCDVAPTILRLLNLPQPAEMTGRCLVTLMTE
ncbi:MAG: 2,3-bisphosphoglycerate-independent phosphoglycerate mutase [Gammaproteobacteria bacterium]